MTKYWLGVTVAMSSKECATCEYRNREVYEAKRSTRDKCVNSVSGNYGKVMIADAVCDEYESKKRFVFIVSNDLGVTYNVKGSFDDLADPAIGDLFESFKWPNYRARLIMRPEFVVKKTEEEQKNENTERLQESVEKLRNKFCK